MFTHLHLHTPYSLLDGATAIEPLIERLQELHMTSCAITDHGVMYGVVEFYKAAQKAGIHPVIGCEVYVCADMTEKTGAQREYSHLILLCENQTGYQNLIKLVSLGFTEGFYYRPRVDYDALRRYSEGLIALSACLSGDLPKLLLDGREDEARRVARMYAGIFGENNFFIEIQDHGLPEEKQVLPRLVRLAREENLPLVATNDCHYLRAEDAAAQEVLMCISTGKILSDENRMRMTTDQLYVKSEEEMRALFPALPDALENTNKIAERCHVEFDFKSLHLPRYPLPEGETADGMFERLCREGLKKRYPGEPTEAVERLQYEMGVIRAMGYVDYFLIVWDFIHFARERGILVGPGRGSGAGSIVAYSLFITSVDPLRYALLFERFLNPERVSMPDLDIDFDYERRGEVIDYVAEKYGRDHVAQIITFGTMAARAVLRDVGRVQGLSYQQADAVAKMVPMQLDMTLEKALSLNPDLRAACENDPKVAELMDTAKKLEGLPRHASTHAAGVLITSRPVSDYVPLQTNDDVITTQFPMGTLESLGLLKMDFLGLRTLNVVGDALAFVRQNGKADMTPEQIPLDDSGVYRLISEGDTDGVFQLESGGMRQFLQNMKPENFEDVIAAISLYRPGPMESIPRYIAGKQDASSVHYKTEKLRPILDVTYGCMVYQEQVMQIVRDLAGYSLGRSDLVRRAMAKKKHDVMAKEKEIFIHGLVENGEVTIPGAVRNGVPEEAAVSIFDEMTAFASYAFNKSHAACYAVLAAQTAYLKLHYPTEFMAALLNSFGGNVDKTAFYIQSCRKKGISVLPPDVNRSQVKFAVEGDAIRFGLSAVRGAGERALSLLVSERGSGGEYKSVFDLIERTSGDAVNKKLVEALIRSGALDTLPGNRAQKLAVYERALDGAAKRRKNTVEGQLSLFESFAEPEFLTPPLPKLSEFPLRERLAMEKETTGVYISGHPLDDYRQALAKYSQDTRWIRQSLEDGAELDQRPVRFGGILRECRSKTTRGDQLMGFLQIEDLYGSIEALVFPKVYERLRSRLEPESVLCFSGRLSVREEEEPKLLLEDVAPLESDELGRGKLYLRLLRGQTERVSEILARTPGTCPVIFHLADERKTLRAPESLYISPSFDKIGLCALLGEENVVYKQEE